MRTAALALVAILLLGSSAQAEVALPFAHKLWELRVIALTNPGTSNAVVTARISKEGAEEYCDRDPGGETIANGGKLTKAQCVLHLLARERAKTYVFKANCTLPSIWNGLGWYRQLRPNRHGSMLWQEVRTKHILPADGASNHDAHNAQLKMLCPGSQTTDF